MDHIITAVFEPGKIRTVASEPLFQWDYGQTLVFSGIELPTAYQVDFSNFEYCGNSIPQIGGAEGVTVPVDVLTTGQDVYAFVWLQDAESGRTRYMAQIPVIPRPVPDLDDPNPEQESAIAEAIAALNAGVAAAEAAQAAAEQSAEDAGASAQEAAGSAAEAAGSAAEAGSAVIAAQAAQAAAEAAQTAAEQSAEDAAESAQEAAGSASAAAGSASDAGSAVQAAEAAQAAAEAAEEAAVQIAETARGSAQAAAGSAAAAAGSVAEAGNAASAAEQSAAAAGYSAQAAAGSATSAGRAASAAAASATAAGNAQTAAETAQEAAETAQDAAEAAAASVSASSAQIAQNTADIAQNTADIASLEEDRYKAYATDTASGSIASFPDGADDIPVKSLVVDIEPVQDLHGYDAPWPAGGGVNLLPPYSLPSVTDKGITLTNNNGEYTLDGTTASDVAVFDIRVNLPAGQYTVALNNPTANSKVQIYGVDENNAVPMQVLCSTANTTATVTFESTVKIFRIRVLRDGTVDNFKLSPVFSAGATAATRFYPYENICPISGRTGAKVTRTGKNLCGESFTHGIYASTNGVYYSHEGSATRYVAVGIIPVKGGQTYTMSWDDDTSNTASVSAIVFFSGTDYFGFVQNRNPFTVPDGADRIAVNLFLSTAISSISDVSIANLQIELGSTATAYEPYQGDAYGIAFPSEAGTVYGGTLDVTGGKMVVDRVLIVLNGSESGWRDYPSYNGYYITISEMMFTTRARGISNMLVARYDSQRATNAMWLGVASKNLFVIGVYDSMGSTLADFKAFLSTNNLQVVIPLDSPIEITLTPTQIDTLLGTNNIWADCGDSTVEYRADTKLYVDKKIAAIPTASGVSF